MYLRKQEHTMKKPEQAPIGHVIIDQELLLPCKVISSEAHHIEMPQPSQYLHVLLKFPPPSDTCIFQPLHCHHRSIVQDSLVRCPETTFSEHLGRCSQKVLQFEPLHSLEEHHVPLLVPGPTHIRQLRKTQNNKSHNISESCIKCSATIIRDKLEITEQTIL